jgi:hypothetical protein
MAQWLYDLWRVESGQDLIEYSLLLTFFALTIMGLVYGGSSSVQQFQRTANVDPREHSPACRQRGCVPAVVPRSSRYNRDDTAPMIKLRIVLLLAFPYFASAASLDSLTASARNLKGELAGEALLRLAAAPQLAASVKTELLELAFERASEAAEPYRRQASGLRLQAAGAFAKPYLQEMDGLSLRLRAVEAMLPVDLPRALRLFERIPPVSLPPLKCQDVLVYDVSRLYDVLDAIVHRGFTAAEASGGPAQLLERYAVVTSPFQAGPLARVIAGAGLPDAAFSAVVAVYAKALGRLQADDRSFSAARTLGAEIEKLAAECRRRGISALPLLESYRVYLVIHLSSARCADSDLTLTGTASSTAQGAGEEAAPGDVITFFNRKLRIDPLKPIEELESTPTRLEGTVATRLPCQSAGCQSFAARYQELFFSGNGQPLPVAARETPEWAERLRAVLQLLSGWKPDREPGAIQFREKAEAYALLLGLVPAGPNRDLVMRAELGFLEDHPLRNSNPLEWFLPVNALVGRTTLDPAGMAASAGSLRSSKDPVIALFANLEQALPRSPERILPLL